MLRRKSLLLGILVIAFLLRAAVAVGVHGYLAPTGSDFLIPGDAAGYWELGKRLAEEGQFTIYEPPRRVMRMPGFPAFLALSVHLAGDNLLAARLMLAAVGALACWPVYWLGRELFDAPTGLIAAGLVAVWPTMVGFSVVILSETLFAACLVSSLVVAAKLATADSATAGPCRVAGLALATGLLVAVASYVRPTWLLAAPLFAVAHVVLARNKRRALWSGGVVVASLLAALLPWMIRNYGVTGKFVATTLWVGPSLYDGLNPEATGDSDMDFIERDRLFHRMSEYDVDRHYRASAWKYALTNPGRSLWLAGRKLVRYWKPWPNAAQFDDWRLCVLVGLPFALMVSSAFYGLCSTRDRPWAWLLTVGPILYFAAVHAVFVGSLRYRLPAEYPLCVMSAVGLRHLFVRRPL